MSSLLAKAMARYSASTDDLETVVCFFVFQAIGAVPSVIKYPEMECLVMGHEAQSESQ